MATQTGVLSLSGKLDKQVYYQRNGKTFARKAHENHQQSESSRKSGTEFGRASAAASLVQKTFAEDLDHVMDGSCFLRLTRCLGEVIRTAYNKPKGERNVADGDIALLKGFQLNKFAATNRLLVSEPFVDISPKTKLRITLPAFPTDPKIFRSPMGAEILVVQLCGSVFDFVKKQASIVRADDLRIKLEMDGQFPGARLRLPVGATHNQVLILTVAYHFLDKDGYLFNNRQYCAGKIIEAGLVRNWQIVPFQYPPASASESTPSVKNSRNKISWTLNKD